MGADDLAVLADDAQVALALGHQNALVGQELEAHAPFKSLATTETSIGNSLFTPGARVCPAKAGLKSSPLGGRVSKGAPGCCRRSGRRRGRVRRALRSFTRAGGAERKQRQCGGFQQR